MHNKLISVIMSNYNTPENYLRESIESIINQTYQNFELIIIDDCSTDNSVKIIESYNDSRIKLIINNENLGITKSLNKGIAVSNGSYIARMDADDVSLPERFEKQVKFLESNPSAIVCGTAIEFVGDGAHLHKSKTFYRQLPSMEEMQINLLFGNFTNIVHPSAMFNAALLKSNNIKYNENYRYAQDYRMWVDCCRVGECVNLKDVLLQYRVHNKAVSSDKINEQKECVKSIIKEQLGWLYIDLSDDFFDTHYGLINTRKDFQLSIKKWFKIIINQNKKHKIYNEKILKKLLWNKWAEIVYFGFRNAKGFDKLRVLSSLPIYLFPQLYLIFISRIKKGE